VEEGGAPGPFEGEQFLNYIEREKSMLIFGHFGHPKYATNPC